MIAAAFIAIVIAVIVAALTLYAATVISGESQPNEETPADVPHTD